VTYSDFRNKIDHDLKKYCLRYGQTVMNTLSEVWPDKHRELISTDLDCFYNDNKADTTLGYLEKIWNNEASRQS
jgi:hypothetical protein